MSSSLPVRFSVVIPCYNQGTFLHECLESLSAQTLPAHEIIVVDDGSTDAATVQRMDELCVEPIKLIRQENRGLPGARNTGIRAATGEWILPLDADDCLAPHALASYARAIERQPEVAIWYPDVEYFGLESLLFESLPFNAWRQLWENLFVCSSAIHRRVFEAGVLYNERMRQGYEDWEFFVHACVERGFVARGLEQAVFRYRRWGYSMLSESEARRAELLEQLHRERPIYRDEQRLLELKRQHEPYLAIAAGSEALRPALEGQTLRDCDLVDESGRVQREESLAVFQGRPLSRVMVSLADAPLAAALRADPFLLEKVARVLQERQPAVLWLVTTEPGQAWPGFLLPEHEARQAPLRCVGFCLDPSRLVDAPPIPRTEAGLLGDLARHLHQRAPGSVAWMVVGPRLEEEEGHALPWATPAGVGSAPISLGERKQLFLQAVRLMGQGTSKLVRGAVGPQRHDRLLETRALRRLRSRLLGARAAEPSPESAPPPPGEYRQGPFASWQLTLKRHRHALMARLRQPPRFDERPVGGEPALLIAVPWIVHGGVDRAIVDLLQGLRRVAPQQRCYLVATLTMSRPTPMIWANEIVPRVEGFFSLQDVAPNAPIDLLAQLAERLGVGALLIANSQLGFDALPKLRQLKRRIRVISQAHNFLIDPVTGELGGHCAYSASRYNNLIDGYAAISQDTTDIFTQRLYVSPTKIRIVLLGVDTARFATAYRPRFLPQQRVQVLWLARMVDQKDPITCLKVARLWKQRHGSERLGFRMVGSGDLEASVREYIRQHALEDVVTLEPGVDDPVPCYRSADCLLLTSKYEGIPVVIYEAMAAGLPVVTAVPNTAIPEVLTDQDAWLIHRQQEPADYVAALEDMLARPEEVRARIERMRQASVRFDQVRYARETLELLFPEPQRQPLLRVAP